MKTKPLYWPIDWTELSLWDRLFMWNPIFGKARRIHQDLVQQLNARSKSDLCEWDKYSKEIQNIASGVSSILEDMLGWPTEAIFLPEDPADIPFWDSTGDLDSVEAVIDVEKYLKIQMPDDFWEDLSGQTYAQLLQKLYEIKKEAEQLRDR